MERADIQELLQQDPELFGQLMTDLGVPARDRRQTPFTQWTHGEKACKPGVCFPRMREAAGPLRARLRGGQRMRLYEEWDRRAARRRADGEQRAAGQDAQRGDEDGRAREL